MIGGLHLFAHKHASAAAPIANASVPKSVRLEIPSIDNPSLQAVIGDSVFLGQSLARTNGRKARLILSPVSGTIAAIKQEDSATQINCEALVITIENDGKDRGRAAWMPIDDFKLLTPAQLCERIEQAGIVGLGGAAFPTSVKLASAVYCEQLTLIINGAECEPFITCDDALMREHANEVIFGTQVLLHACQSAKAIIAIESDKSVALAAVDAALKKIDDPRISICAVRTIYPAGDERQLITALTGREIPSGGIPADINMLCQNVGTAVAAAHLVLTGQPLVERVVTITGGGIREPRNFRARFGTPISHLIAECGGYTTPIEKLIMGGSMMGVALGNDRHVVSAATNCIIAATHTDLQPRAAEMPCIRCGDCSHACPANLLPQQLLRFTQRDDRFALRAHGLQDCIECGCCDYVCPSHIPLVSKFIDAKRRQAAHS